MEPLLSVNQIHAGYADVQVLWDVDCHVQKGEIACIVGSNGAGKTTLLRTLSGVVRATGGTIKLADRDITNASPETILGAGIAHVPEGRRLFKGLSVRDNLLLGAYLRRASRATIRADLQRMYDLFPILAERSSQDATTLSGGEQQMCAIARGIMSDPKLLLIDELSLGLAPKAVELLSEALIEINASGMTILLVEQDVMTALDLASSAIVIDNGRVVKTGSSSMLANDPQLREAYMGL